MQNFYERLKSARSGSGLPESPETEKCVRETIASLLSQPTDARRPGMLLGKIQSGKTRAFLSIIASAFDHGFDVAVVLTKGTRTLARQTVNRIASEFKIFRDAEQLAVYDIMAVPDLTPWEIDDQKLVFVAKKETNNLRRLVNLFAHDYPSLAGKRVLIVDDEADFASIRFTKKRGADEVEQGRIADRIDDLRRELTNPAILQVTATPYSLYLQPDEYESSPGSNFTFEPKRPAFTHLVPVHKGYIGGDHYFGEHDEGETEYYLRHDVSPEELSALRKEDRRRIKADQVLESDKIQALRHALITFVVGASIRRLQQTAAGETRRRYSMIVHVETSRKAHAWQYMVASEILDAMGKAAKTNRRLFEFLVDTSISDLHRSIATEKLNIPDRAAIVAEVQQAFARSAVVIEKVNSDNDVEALLDENAELRLRTPYNVFIGGQILDRGITVPNLIGFYYGRSPKRMQQDTVLQHARMYGSRPRPDLAVTRFYTTSHNYEALKTVHEFDSALRYAFETGAHDRGVAFVVRDSAKGIIPCAPSKIMASDLVALRPGSALLPIGFQSLAKTSMRPILQAFDALIPSTAVDTAAPVKINTETAVKLVDLAEASFTFETGYSFDWEACRAAIEYFSRIVSPPTERNQCWLYVQTGRTLSRVRPGGRYSDAPHTYQDRDVARRFGTNLPVLALFQQEGRAEDGWRGTPFWWPVLFAPLSALPSIFASSIDETDQEESENDEAPEFVGTELATFEVTFGDRNSGISVQETPNDEGVFFSECLALELAERLRVEFRIEDLDARQGSLKVRGRLLFDLQAFAAIVGVAQLALGLPQAIVAYPQLKPALAQMASDVSSALAAASDSFSENKHRPAVACEIMWDKTVAECQSHHSDKN